MGFFTKDVTPEATTATGLPQISKERVKHALDRADWSYNVDSDGDIHGGWEPGWFYFLVQGQQEELFCVRGYWRAQLEASQYQEALEACNDWNRAKLWPKTHVGKDDEGNVRINVEHNVDYEHGVTDEQLSLHLLTVITTGLSFFKHLNETFPEAWEKCKPESD